MTRSPARAVRVIERVLREERGNFARACRVLECSRPHAFQFLRRVGSWAMVERVREEAHAQRAMPGMEPRATRSWRKGYAVIPNRGIQLSGEAWRDARERLALMRSRRNVAA